MHVIYIYNIIINLNFKSKFCSKVYSASILLSQFKNPKTSGLVDCQDAGLLTSLVA